MKRTFFLVLAAVLLGGCQGPETKVLPRQRIPQERPYEPVGHDAVLEEASPFYQQEALRFLAAAPRVSASPEETNAAEYIKRMLIEYGYDVTIQRFLLQPEEASAEVSGRHYGTNVIAVKEAGRTDSDILLILTNHDTAAATPGANDNASGVVAFLETARLVAGMRSDTELRFVSLSGMEAGQRGLGYFLETLTPQERQRISGAVQLDTLGYLEDERVVLETIDGKPTLFGDLLKETAADVFELHWSYRMDQQSRYSLFDSYLIPVVRVTQQITAFERHTWQDRPEIVDVEKIVTVSQILAQTLADIMQAVTPSYLEASQNGRYERDGALRQLPGQAIPFGAAPAEADAYYGRAGYLLEDEPDVYQLYQYPMKWLGVDQIILSDFLYREGQLVRVILEAEAAGITAAEMTERLTDQYGQPQLESDSTAWGDIFTEAAIGSSSQEIPVLSWRDYAGRKIYKLLEWPEGYTVVAEAGSDTPVEVGRYPVSENNAGPLQQSEAEGGSEPAPAARERAALELTRQILRPEDFVRAAEIVLYTDGLGRSQAYWTEEGEEASKRLVLYVDLEDMTDQAGNYRNYAESCSQLVKAYAYFYDEPYRRLFYENFDQTMGKSSSLTYGQIPGEEFAYAFQLFVLTGEPEGRRTEADEELLFFYQHEPLIAVRNDIRRQLGLSV